MMSPHPDVWMRQLLKERFPMQWIVRKGPLEWPARSPDSTPVDSFLWVQLNSKVYSTGLDELRQRIGMPIAGPGRNE